MTDPMSAAKSFQLYRLGTAEPHQAMIRPSIRVELDQGRSLTGNTTRTSTLTVSADTDPRHPQETHSRPIAVTDSRAVALTRTLGKLIDEIIDRARKQCPGYILHSNLDSPADPAISSQNDRQGAKTGRYRPLHVSLTHPLPLRRSQIDPFRLAVTKNIRSLGLVPLHLSFAGALTAYTNGRRTGGEGTGGRAFLALRTSAGSEQVSFRQAFRPVRGRLADTLRPAEKALGRCDTSGTGNTSPTAIPRQSGVSRFFRVVSDADIR